MEIERRVDRLERENRRLKVALISLVSVAVVIFVLGQTKTEKVPDLIRARKFEVIGETGAPVVALGSFSNLGGWIKTANNSGKALFQVGVSDNGKAGIVSTFDGDGHGLVFLSADYTGGQVRTLNRKGADLVVLGTGPGGVGAIDSLDGSGRVLTRIGTSDEGFPAIATRGKSENDLVRVTATEDGGMLAIMNSEGNPGCTVGVDVKGNGAIGAWEPSGRGRALRPGSSGDDELPRGPTQTEGTRS